MGDFLMMRAEGRLAYYELLDNAHIDGNYAPFIALVAQLERATLNRYFEVILGE
jgi:hypothetical protein